MFITVIDIAEDAEVLASLCKIDSAMTDGNRPVAVSCTKASLPEMTFSRTAKCALVKESGFRSGRMLSSVSFSKPRLVRRSIKEGCVIVAIICCAYVLGDDFDGVGDGSFCDVCVDLATGGDGEEVCPAAVLAIVLPGSKRGEHIVGLLHRYGASRTVLLQTPGMVMGRLMTRHHIRTKSFSSYESKAPRYLQ